MLIAIREPSPGTRFDGGQSAALRVAAMTLACLLGLAAALYALNRLPWEALSQLGAPVALADGAGFDVSQASSRLRQDGALDAGSYRIMRRLELGLQPDGQEGGQG